MKSLGDRMKGYESQAESRLLRRLPVVVRIDGKAFHTLTSKLERPYCKEFSDVMAETLLGLCTEVSGCVYGYTQSDELTLVLQNDASLDTEPLFDNRVQKLASVIASMATLFFNERVYLLREGRIAAPGGWTELLVGPAMFDTRVFTVPSWGEAANCLIWRQQDCTKNAIQMAAQAVLGKKLGRKTAQKMLHGKNGKEQQELMFKETGTNFNDYPISFRRGISCTKTEEEKFVIALDGAERSRIVWELNYEMPILRIVPEQPPLDSDSIRTWGVDLGNPEEAQ